MKKLRRIFMRHKLLASLLLVVVTAGAAGTVALVVAMTDPVTNTFQAASLDTEIDEPEPDPDNPENTKPENKVVKIVNKKSSPAYIRVRITVSPEGAAAPIYNKEVANGVGWTDGGDGFYYYTTAVGGGEETANIINGVTVSEEFEKSRKEFDVTVYQESCVADTEVGEMTTVDHMEKVFDKSTGSETAETE